jgi:hypothetical protein
VVHLVVLLLGIQLRTSAEQRHLLPVKAMLAVEWDHLETMGGQAAVVVEQVRQVRAAIPTVALVALVAQELQILTRVPR